MARRLADLEGSDAYAKSVAFLSLSISRSPLQVSFSWSAAAKPGQGSGN